MRKAARVSVVLLMLIACGSQDGGADETPGDQPKSDAGTVPTTGPTSSAQPPSDAGLDADPIVGLWSVSGTDARGAYDGEVEVRPDASAGAAPGRYTFIRNIHYRTATVADARELYWLFQGKLTKGGSDLAVDASLKRIGFITKIGSLERSASDVPVALSGKLTIDSAASSIAGTIVGAGGSVSVTDTWTARKPLPAAPIFVDERKVVPAHAPPTAQQKQSNFQLYASFRTLDKVKPYVNRPEFEAAVHGHEIDTTDRDFYRAHKNALRVTDKVIDDISITETLRRANAYRYTFAEKAALFQADLGRFIDPQVGMLPEYGPPGGTYTDVWESGDSTLWTGVYVASQAYRYEVTAEPDALANLILSLDALLKLQEITGDWEHFARVLRRPKASQGSPSWVWHDGTGPYANLQWLEGGNNDMIKGLFYGYLMGWEALCEGGKTGHEALCARIRTNAKHIVDDVKFQGSNSPTSEFTRSLPATWLYAIVADDPSDQITYGTKLEGTWALSKTLVFALPNFYDQGICDWSGQHLGSVATTVEVFLAQHKNVGGDAQAVVRQYLDTNHKNFEQQRFPTWHFLKAAFGTGASPTSPFVQAGLERMAEVPYPKISYAIDHRMKPDFCMSPYPVVPWKGDWMSPTEDRTMGLNSYPLFEEPMGVNLWMMGNDYAGGGDIDAPGSDYLHLYWFARKFGLLNATD